MTEVATSARVIIPRYKTLLRDFVFKYQIYLSFDGSRKYLGVNLLTKYSVPIPPVLLQKKMSILVPFVSVRGGVPLPLRS
jgi:restriction endonuclease S subunit